MRTNRITSLDYTISKLGEAVLEIGRTVPGWTVLTLLLIIVILMIGGRALDLLETTTHGVEEKIGQIPVDTNNITLKQLMPEYGYKTLARTLWITITTLTATLLVILAVAKIVGAFIKRGEEV